jgi:hypothetical protein
VGFFTSCLRLQADEALGRALIAWPAKKCMSGFGFPNRRLGGGRKSALKKRRQADLALKSNEVPLKSMIADPKTGSSNNRGDAETQRETGIKRNGLPFFLSPKR